MIIIAGIHNSGTGYLSKCINKVMPMWINEAGGGHHEDGEILSINIRELSFRGVKWYDYKAGKKKGTIIKDLESYKKKCRGGFKDPRIIYLYNDYKKVFPDAKYIVCLKSKKHVTTSLVKKGKIPAIEIANKWYDKEILWAKKIKGVHFCDFDANKGVEQEKLNKFLGFKVDIISDWNNSY